MLVIIVFYIQDPVDSPVHFVGLSFLFKLKNFLLLLGFPPKGLKVVKPKRELLDPSNSAMVNVLPRIL